MNDYHAMVLRQEMLALRSDDGAADMPDEDKVYLARLANMIPPAGIAVEIGSLLGGSAKIILDNMPRDAALICIDQLWSYANQHVIFKELFSYMYEKCNLRYYESAFDFAKRYLDFAKNVTLIPAKSPYDIWKIMPDQVDFVFEDGSHESEQLLDNLEFWYARLRPGGILVVHDFHSTHPNVIQVVSEFFGKLALPSEVIGRFCWARKPIL